MQRSDHNVRDELGYGEIKRRGHQRREVINKSLGSNTNHRNSYYEEKKASVSRLE